MFNLRSIPLRTMDPLKDDQAFVAPMRAHLAAAIVLLYAFWRIWRFTIYPLLHPNVPKEVPYWIPGMCFDTAVF
jgi:hypothetical protein